MENTVGKVVVMTNITKEDFTHNYGGCPFTVKAGESITFPFDVGEHLARHLARKILVSADAGATSWDPKDPTNNGGNGTPLFNEENELSMMKKILGETFTVEREREKTEMERLKEEIAKLNEFRSKVEESAETALSGQVSALGRKELFAKAKELGIAVNVSDTNDTLRSRIAEAERASEANG